MNELAHNNGCGCFLFFTPVAEEYEKAKRSAQPEEILRAVNADAIRFLMGSQLRYLRKLLDKRMEKDRMLACIRLHTDAAVTPAAKPVCTLHHAAQGFLIKNTQPAPDASTKQLRSSQSFRKNEAFTLTGS